jgi:YHS domain-containing protein
MLDVIWHGVRDALLMAREVWWALVASLTAALAIENAVVGPVIAVLSFVCSVGNVPLAAVLWSGGIGFSGVLAFLFADLIVPPMIAIYRKYYGGRFARRITALMFCTMVLAALIVDGIFSALGWVPSGPRPSRSHVFASIELDYKFWLNLVATLLFAALTWLTLRRAVDPVCGVRVDRAVAVVRRTASETQYFCSERCAASFGAAAGHRDGEVAHRDGAATHGHPRIHRLSVRPDRIKRRRLPRRAGSAQARPLPRRGRSGRARRNG